jgi:hypothetical protein
MSDELALFILAAALHRLYPPVYDSRCPVDG